MILDTKTNENYYILILDNGTKLNISKSKNTEEKVIDYYKKLGGVEIR